MLNTSYEFLNNVRLIVGEGSAAHIAEALREAGGVRPLLVSGPVLNRIGAVDMAKKAINDGGTEVPVIFINTPKDSSLAVVNELVNLYYTNNCDSIVAIGGGSVIDTAKGVRLLLSQEASDLSKFKGVEMVRGGKHIPFGVVPTTNGTGSETTKVAVVSDEVNHIKLEFVSEQLLPDFAVLDPNFTVTLPIKASLATAFDALTHAIEAYTGTQRNPISDSYALSAVEMLALNIFPMLDNLTDKKARENVLVGSALAGIAFSNSMVGMVHAVGHALGAACGVAHDVAMTLLLPHVMRFNKEVSGDRYADIYYVLAGHEEYGRTPAAERADKCIEFIVDFIARSAKIAGMSISLADYGVKTEDFPVIVDKTMRDGATITNPREISRADVLAVLESAYEVK